MYKGVALSVLASVTFGVLYFYTFFLQPLYSEQNFAWRMLSTLPFLTAFMRWSFAPFGHGVGWLHPLQGKTIPLANGRGSLCFAWGRT